MSTTPSDPLNPNYSDKLQFICHEEGRLKMITPVSNSDRELNSGGGVVLPSGQDGVFEFFVKDHLGNTRMLLTEEIQTEFYTATMERAPAAVAAKEEQLFGKVESNGSINAGNNELKLTRYENLNPSTTPWPGNTTDFAKLTAAELKKQIGPNRLMKVMAGDMIKTTAKYYYVQNNPSGGSGSPVTNVVTSLINSLMSPERGSGLTKSYAGTINTALSGNADLQTFISTTEINNGNPSAPKAYINVVFLDEQFKFIQPDFNNPGVGTYFERVSSNNDPNATFSLLQQKAPKNGWVFVYLSNESNEPVYFDDFFVSQDHGRISEENHYYPFGLKIAAISSRAVNKKENKYGYQGVFAEEDVETGYDEFDLRTYDPQIGRWIGPDQYDEFASPYIGMGNDPVSLTDPDGGSPNSSSLASMGLFFPHMFVWGNILGEVGRTFLDMDNSDPKPPVNVAIYFFKNGADDEKEMLKNSDNKDLEQWHIIVASDVIDANKKLREYLLKKGGTVDNLILSSHGGSGFIQAGVGNKSIQDKQIIAYNETRDMTDEQFKDWAEHNPNPLTLDGGNHVSYGRERGNDVKNLLEILDQVKKNGNVVITGCRAGSGAEGEGFGNLLANGRSFNLFLNQDPSDLVSYSEGIYKGLATICWGTGRLTRVPPNLGWIRFVYNEKTGKVEITKGTYDLLIGRPKGKVPVLFKKYLRPKKKKR
jgi:RHS repeat-associated protein